MELIYDNGAKAINSPEKERFFQQTVLGQLDIHFLKKNFDPFHVPKINSDLNGKHKIIKLLLENTGENLCDLEIDKDLLGTYTRSTSHKRKS